MCPAWAGGTRLLTHSSCLSPAYPMGPLFCPYGHPGPLGIQDAKCYSYCSMLQRLCHSSRFVTCPTRHTSTLLPAPPLEGRSPAWSTTLAHLTCCDIKFVPQLAMPLSRGASSCVTKVKATPHTIPPPVASTFRECSGAMVVDTHHTPRILPLPPHHPSALPTTSAHLTSCLVMPSGLCSEHSPTGISQAGSEESRGGGQGRALPLKGWLLSLAAP